MESLQYEGGGPDDEVVKFRRKLQARRATLGTETSQSLQFPKTKPLSPKKQQTMKVAKKASMRYDEAKIKALQEELY